MKVQRDDVVNALRAEDVVNHLGIKGSWRNHWLRSRSCAEVVDHASEAFALRNDGMWHCHACDRGGDLLLLLALSENLSIKDDFPRVLELAAGIAGIDLDPGSDMFGLGPVKPAPRVRPAAPQPLAPLADRVATAKKRAAWAWEHLHEAGALASAYLRSRGLEPDIVMTREPLRATPIRLSDELRGQVERGGNANRDLATLWHTFGTKRGTLSLVCPVRSTTGAGEMVDLRARRVDPDPGRPKIIGMVGGVTSSPAERGKTRQLIGCYGHPNAVDADHVVLVEGFFDYLTALQLWPDAQILGAVEAGTMALVAGLIAAALAARDDTSRLTIVEQSDQPRTLKDGRVVPGAADQALNEDPNSATKVAVRLLRSPRRVGWLYCSHAGDDGVVGSPCTKLGGKPVKDLNDLVVVGADIGAKMTWWTDLASQDE